MNLEKKAFCIIQLNIEVNVESDDISFVTLNLDSITFIKIVVALESEFDIEFEDEKLLISIFPTVKSMVSYVRERVESKNDR